MNKVIDETNCLKELEDIIARLRADEESEILAEELHEIHQSLKSSIQKENKKEIDSYLMMLITILKVIFLHESS